MQCLFSPRDQIVIVRVDRNENCNEQGGRDRRSARGAELATILGERGGHSKSLCRIHYICSTRLRAPALVYARWYARICVTNPIQWDKYGPRSLAGPSSFACRVYPSPLRALISGEKRDEFFALQEPLLSLTEDASL